MATVYVNGTVYTMRHEGDQCTAFVVEDGKFMYCGTDEGARAFGEGCQVVDLKGKTVIPGMIDTHQHLFAYARDLLKLNLKGAGSKKELEMIRERALHTPEGEWILGTGFDHEKFTDQKRTSHQGGAGPGVSGSSADHYPVLPSCECGQFSCFKSRRDRTGVPGKGGRHGRV